MNNEKKTPKIIETASATTSHDNKNSGPFAYIITAVALGFLLIVSLATAGCISVVVAAVADEATTSSGVNSPSYNPYTDMDFDNMDWEEFLKEYENEFGYGTDEPSQNENPKDQETGMAPVADVLGFSIAPYGETIDDDLSASAYAGVPTNVRNFVRSVESTDKDYVNKLQACLDAATHDENQRSAKIAEAITLCDEAKKAMDALEIPSIENDDGGAIKDALGTAKTEAARRWELMAAELNILNTNEDIDTKKLWDADEKVVESTEKSAELLEEAMELTTKH